MEKKAKIAVVGGAEEVGLKSRITKRSGRLNEANRAPNQIVLKEWNE